MTTKKLLEQEIQSEFSALSDMQAGTDEYKTTLDGLTKLIDREIEIERLQTDRENKYDDREIDVNLKTAQLESERKDRLLKNWIGVAGIVIPSAITVWGTLKSLKFEEEGTVTTIMGRGFINKLLPKK